jgi:hypothetical protein
MKHEVLKAMVAEHVSALRKQVAEAGTFSGQDPEDWYVGQEIARLFPDVALAAATEMLTGPQWGVDQDEFWGVSSPRARALTLWARSSYAVGSNPLSKVREMFPGNEWGYASCEGAVPKGKGVKSLWIGGLASIWRR